MEWTRIGQVIPAIDSQDIQNGVRILITFNNVTRALADILHGRDGSDGQDGKDGSDGSDGQDGKDGIDGTHDVLSATISEEDGSSRIELFKQTHTANDVPLWPPESLGVTHLPYGKSALSIGYYRIDVSEDPTGYIHFEAQYMCATEWDNGNGTFIEVGDPIDLGRIKIPFAPMTVNTSLDWVELSADYGNGPERIGFWQRALRPVLSNSNKHVTMDLTAYDGAGGEPVIAQSYSWKDAHYAVESMALDLNNSTLTLSSVTMGGGQATTSVNIPPSPTYDIVALNDRLVLRRDGTSVSEIDNFRQRFKYWIAQVPNNPNAFELIEQEHLALSPVGDAVPLYRYEPSFDGVSGLGLAFTPDKSSLTITNGGSPLGTVVSRDSFGTHYRYRLVWSSVNRRYELWARPVSSVHGDGEEFLASHAICCFDDPNIQFEEMLKDILEELLLGGLLDAYFGTKSLPPKDLKEEGGWAFNRLLSEFNEIEIPYETKAALAAIVMALAAAYLAPVAIPATAGSEAVLGVSVGGLGLATLVPPDGQLSVWEYPSSFWDFLTSLFGGGGGSQDGTNYTPDQIKMLIAGGLGQASNWLTGDGPCDLPKNGKPMIAMLTSEQLASATALANTIKFQGWQANYPVIPLEMYCGIETLEQAIEAFAVIANTNTDHGLHRLLAYMMGGASMACFERLLSYAELLDLVHTCEAPDPQGGYGIYDLTSREYPAITYSMPSYNPICTWELGKGIRSTNIGGTWNGKHIIVATLSLTALPQNTYVDVELEWELSGFTTSSSYRVNSGYEYTIQELGIITTLSDYESTGSTKTLIIYADTKIDTPSWLRKITIIQR